MDCGFFRRSEIYKSKNILKVIQEIVLFGNSFMRSLRLSCSMLNSTQTEG